MANKKLEYKDVAEIGLFDPLKKEIKEVIAMLANLEKALKGMAKEAKESAESNPLENYKDAKKAEEDINKTRKALTELEKAERKRKNLQESLKQVEADREKGLFEIQERLKETKKQYREEAKQAINNANTYKKLTKEVNEAQTKFKSLAAEFGINSKEAKKAHKEFLKVDVKLREINNAAKDGRRDVGRYRLAISKLSRVFNALASATIVVKILQGLGQAFNTNADSAAVLEKVIGGLSVAFSVIVARIIKASEALTNSFNSAFLKSQRLVEKGKLTWLEYTNILNKNSEEIEKQKQILANLDQEIAANANTNKDFASSFDGIFEEIQKGIKTFSDYVDINKENRKQIIALKKANSEFAKEQARLNSIAEDDTRSLEEQANAKIKLIEINDKIATNSVAIAQKEVQALAKKAEAQKNNLDAQEAYTEAIVNLATVEAEATAQRLDGEARLRKIERDNLELDLDQLIDIADRRKTVREEESRDLTLTFQERQEALNKAIAEFEKSYRRQIEVIEQNTGLTFDLDSIIAEGDITKINERIKAIGLDEITQNRLREVIQDRIQGIRDLKTAQDDLTASQETGKELQSQILIQEKTIQELQKEGVNIQKILASFEEKTLEKSIENLKFRISLYKKGTEERLNLEKELNEKIIELNTNRINKELDKEKRKQQALQEIQESAFGVLSQLSDKYSDKQLSQIDKQIKASEEREQRLRELAKEGQQTANESLAQEEKRQAELTLARKKEEKRRQRIEFAIAAIETYTAKINSGIAPNQALGDTFKDLTVLTQLINSLPGFFQGTEDTGNRGIAIDKEGKKVTGFVHENERVFTKEENKLLKGISNKEAALIVNKELTKPKQDKTLKELQALRKAIESRPVYMGSDIDTNKKLITKVFSSKNKTVRETSKISLWR